MAVEVDRLDQAMAGVETHFLDIIAHIPEIINQETFFNRTFKEDMGINVITMEEETFKAVRTTLKEEDSAATMAEEADFNKITDFNKEATDIADIPIKCRISSKTIILPMVEQQAPLPKEAFQQGIKVEDLLAECLVQRHPKTMRATIKNMKKIWMPMHQNLISEIMNLSLLMMPMRQITDKRLN